jgi:hypothetical protein
MKKKKKEEEEKEKEKKRKKRRSSYRTDLYIDHFLLEDTHLLGRCLLLSQKMI